MEESAVYSATFKDELMYIGSTVSTRRRWSEHRNPNYKKHGDFGKYIHKYDIVDRIVFRVLEKFAGYANRDELKRNLRCKEFVWKHALPKQRFGQNDGVCHQPKDVQRKITNLNNRTSRLRRVETDPLFYEKEKRRRRRRFEANPERYRQQEQNTRIKHREAINSKSRIYNAARAAKDGRVVRHRGIREARPFCPIRAATNKKMRETRQTAWDKAGKKYTPRLTREARLFELYLEFLPTMGPIITAFTFL